MTAKMSIAEIEAFLEKVFPQIDHGGKALFVEGADYRRARVRMKYAERLLRPGGTISGPSMMTLADFAAYVAVLASAGPVALAVTTSFSINFLRRPEPRDLIGDVRLIKLGKRLAVAEIEIRSDGEEEMAAHALATYSIPPK